MRAAVTIVAVLSGCTALVASPRAHARPIPCAAITVRPAGNDFSYRVRIERGRVACLTARTVLRSFIRTRVTPRGWLCFRGHGADTWAASGGGVRLPWRGVVIRAYLIAG